MICGTGNIIAAAPATSFRQRLVGPADGLHQAQGRIGAIIMIIEILGEEEMAGQLAYESRLNLLVFLFEERMAGAPHERLAAAGR